MLRTLLKIIFRPLQRKKFEVRKEKGGYAVYRIRDNKLISSGNSKCSAEKAAAS